MMRIYFVLAFSFDETNSVEVVHILLLVLNYPIYCVNLSSLYITGKHLNLFLVKQMAKLSQGDLPVSVFVNLLQ